jgi:hypothetical protein
MHQLLYSYQTPESHILLELTITQELHQWIQMLLFGKELISMMEKTLVITKTNKVKPILSNNTVKIKKQQQTPDFHMLQPSNLNHK